MRKANLVWFATFPIAAITVVAVAARSSCRPAAPETLHASSSSSTAADDRLAAAHDSAFLAATASAVVAEIGQLETTKDVTCWTSFRQLDSFISSGEYSNFATLAKISAVKSLVRATWEKASRQAPGATVTAADLAKAAGLGDAGADKLDIEAETRLAAFATDLGMKAYKDYRTTSEHWRVVLAVLQDEMRAGTTNLKPLQDGALGALAENATQASLRMLRRAGSLARDERSPMIEATHVKRAHGELAAAYELRNAPPEPKPLGDALVRERIGPLTRALIDGKIRALQIYNKDSKELTADLNRVSKVPISPEAAAVWLKELQSFTHFVAGGYEPMQADNFLADGHFAPAPGLPGKAYVDAPTAENATLQLFPHVILPNGDVKLRFELNPGAPGAEHPVAPNATNAPAAKKGFDELMLDYRQNAVRDTAIHWIVMQNVWAEKPFAMDPFASEYLSEVVSMMATHYVLRAEALARATGKAAVDADLARKVRDPAYVMVMPVTREFEAWSADRWQRKEAVLARYPSPLFADVTATSGVRTSEPKLPDSPTDSLGRFNIQRAMGSGVALGDFDDDGYSDLFVAGEGMGRLYRNLGKGSPGHFEDVTDARGIPAGLDDATGTLFFDMEGDGDQDLLILRSEHPALLLRQEPGGHFVDVAGSVGLVTHAGAHVASIFDSDGDGDLDVYVAYYGSDASNRDRATRPNVPSMDGRNGSPHELWQLGKDGHYANVASRAGVDDTGWTLASTAFDYDNDGDQDLFLANDFGADTFYRNKGDGTFEDVSTATATGDRGSGMNASVADVNGDGFFDLYVSNIDMFSKNIKIVYPNDKSTINNMDASLQLSFQYLSGNKLFINPADPKGNKAFSPEQATRFEPGDRGWAWSANFFDYENDGDEDMYLAAGWLEGSHAANQKQQMFLMEGGTFYLARPASPEAFAANGRSVVSFDADRDGDVDLFANNFRHAPVMLENVSAKKNHYLALRLRGRGGNANGIGSRLTVVAGGRRQIRELSCGNGYLGQMDRVVSFGLGDATEVMLSVRWPNGKEQTVPNASIDRLTDVVESP